MLYTKIIRVSSNWRIMADDQVARGLATSISYIISSLIGSRSRNYLYNSAPLWT